jgi:hypothetical protein
MNGCHQYMPLAREGTIDSKDIQLSGPLSGPRMERNGDLSMFIGDDLSPLPASLFLLIEGDE